MSKVVLISGGNHGIGFATAKQLASEGCFVYAGMREEEAKEKINKIGAHPIKLDVQDEDTLESAVNTIIKEHGKIDVLINNAGWGHYGPVEEIPSDVARKIIDVNLFGLARLTQLVLPHMRKNESGTIINISSIGGKIYFPLGAWYHASKHAVEGWSDCLRVELTPLGIKVIIIEPGIIDTGFNEKMIGRIKQLKSTSAYEDTKDAMLNSIDPNNPGSKPEVIAKTISKALSKQSPKSRYYAGKLAGTVINVRRIFGDRIFDALLRSQIKSNGKKVLVRSKSKE